MTRVKSHWALGVAAAMAVASFNLPAIKGPAATLPRGPRISVPRSDPDRDTSERNRRRRLAKSAAKATARENRENARLRRRKRAAFRFLVRKSAPHLEFVDKMTNWQRNQWARAGYPNDQAKDFSKLRRVTS